MGPLDFASMANTKWYMNLVTDVEPGRDLTELKLHNPMPGVGAR